MNVGIRKGKQPKTSVDFSGFQLVFEKGEASGGERKMTSGPRGDDDDEDDGQHSQQGTNRWHSGASSGFSTTKRGNHAKIFSFGEETISESLRNDGVQSHHGLGALSRNYGLGCQHISAPERSPAPPGTTGLSLRTLYNFLPNIHAARYQFSYSFLFLISSTSLLIPC